MGCNEGRADMRVQIYGALYMLLVALGVLYNLAEVLQVAYMLVVV